MALYAEDWATLAAALGLAPFLATAEYAPGMGFRQLLRTFSGPASAPPSYAHQLSGRWRGTEVVVLTYEVGAVLHTGVLARVDPPLFLGLDVRRRPLLRGLLGGECVELGVDAFDKSLMVSAFNPARAKTFFAPNAPTAAPLLDALARELPSELLVSDSVVDLSTPSLVTDRQELAARLDRAVSLAQGLVARRAQIAWTREELAHRAEWQAFANARGYTFSPERMRLTGEERGATLEVALETEPRGARTSVSVRFPTPVGFGFTVRRAATPSFLQELAGQDIRLGREPFDRLFVVTASSEARLRELLQRAALTDLLEELGTLSQEVELTHEGLFFRLDGAFPRHEQVSQLVERGRVATAGLYGEATSLRPYR